MQIIESITDITYESLGQLAKKTSYTDHIYHFKALFEVIKPNTFLEWGCGFSTKIFLDNSEKVISIEIVTPGVSDIWFLKCKELFKDETNWTPILYVASRELAAACDYQCSIHKDYAKKNGSTYVSELDQCIKKLIEANNITISFVDPGIYIRGDIVELLLQNKIPIVIAHDTSNSYPDYPSLVERRTDIGQYGWFKIGEHSDYEKVFIDHGQGTTFWISKDLLKVIERMRRYRDNKEYIL